MSDKPRVVAFIDAMNVIGRVNRAFGYAQQNYDPLALAQLVADKQGWELVETRFYTGIPKPVARPGLFSYWMDWISQYIQRGLTVITRDVGYWKLIDEEGKCRYELKPQKRIDIRIAFDMRTYAVEGKFDVALLFSQDNDFAEAAFEIKQIGRETGKELNVACAFPEDSKRASGVQYTEWIRYSKQEYDQCLDLNSYGADFSVSITSTVAPLSAASHSPFM